MCSLGPRTFVTLGWICRKQTSVSHSAAESGIVGLESVAKLEGLQALMLLEAMHDVISSPATSDARVPNKSKKASASRDARNACPVLRPETTKTPVQHSPCPMPASIAEKLPSIDDIPILSPIGTGRAKLFVMEENDACIKICVKGKSPAMRHASGTHKVNLDWLYERVMYDTGVHRRFCPTQLQMADTLTKGSFSSVNGRKLFDLCNIMESRKLAEPQNKPTLTISAHKGKGRAILKYPNTTTHGKTQFVPGLVALTRRDMIESRTQRARDRETVRAALWEWANACSTWQLALRRGHRKPYSIMKLAG